MTANPKWLGKGDLNYGGLGKQWIYNATAAGANDAIAAVNTAGYFNAMYKDLAVNDVIRVIATDGIFNCIVNANTYDPVAGTGTVDVTDGVAITATDSD